MATLTAIESLTCDCCGKEVRNTPEDNMALQERTYPCDTGFGWCKECFGDPNSRSFRKRIGWAAQTFYEARFKVIRDNLSAENKLLWDAATYIKKCWYVQKMVEKGVMI